MIQVEPTIDAQYIESVFTNPLIYSATKDDVAPKTAEGLGDFMPKVMAVPGFFLKVIKDGVPAGMFWLIWKDKAVEAHTMLLENCRGSSAIRATKAAIRWVFDNTPAEAINSYAFSDTPEVNWFCRAVGLKPISVSDYPNTRNGQRVLIHNYSIART